MVQSVRLKRLYFRSTHRGSKETDLVVGAYATTQLELMDAEALDIFEAFLDENDNDIWDWVSGKSLPDAKHYHTLIMDLRKKYELPD